MRKVLVVALFLIAFVGTFAGSCDDTTAVEKERNATNNQMSQLLNSQPIPVFEWSLEREIVIDIFRARNEAVSTWSVVQNPYTGAIMFECPSIGYPIPGGTKLTNPYQIPGNDWSNTSIPQAEPNGLYIPESSAGTYINCVNENGTVSPVFEEFYVQTFPFPVEEIDGKLVRVKGVEPTIAIQTQK
jgi:hypothetical protein